MDRRIVKTKNAIRKAYFSLLIEKNVAKITIAEIARRANIDRKTFYLHYESVDGVMKEFSEAKIKELLTSLEQNNFFSQPFYINNIFHALNSILDQNIDFYKQIARSSNYDFFWNQVQKILVETIIDVYSDTVVVTSAELSIYANFFASGMIATYQNWLKEDSSISLEELGETAGKIAYLGIQSIFPPQKK